MKRMLLMIGLLFGSLGAVQGADEKRQAADEAAIHKAVDAYIAAFNKHDAKALAALWSPDAVYTNPVTDEQVVGRAEIEKQFAGVFAGEKNLKLEAKTESIRFVSPNVAVESGTAKVIRPQQAPEESEYTAVYVKRDGQWLLDRVTEEDVPVTPSNYEKLKELDWMIGHWVDEDEKSRIDTTCQWTKNHSFITRSFSVSIRDRIEMSGMQIIGWDAAKKQIRSWVFDSDGGFGEGVWTKKESKDKKELRWYIQTTGTLTDGRKTSAVNILTYLDKDRFTWQSVNRTAGDELLPNVDEVVVVRQTEE